jgi:hypothetical protein
MRRPRGLDRHTFKVVEGWPYVEGLLLDILMTRRGTRVLRRPYGSDLPAFIDGPGNRVTILQMLADVAIACDQIRDLTTGEAVVRFHSAQELTADRNGQYGLVCAFEDLVEQTRREIRFDRLSEAA